MSICKRHKQENENAFETNFNAQGGYDITFFLHLLESLCNFQMSLFFAS